MLPLNDWMWKQFGYKKRPKRGSIPRKILETISKKKRIKLQKEKFLHREFTIIGINDCTAESPKNPNKSIKVANNTSFCTVFMI